MKPDPLAGDLISVSFLLILIITCSVGSAKHPDVDRNLEQLIRSRGFNYELKQVKTADGVSIGVARILNADSNFTAGKPVILQHGFFGEATDWLINDGSGHIEEKVVEGQAGGALAFELAKRGYDVWLPNSRGNRYSPLPRNERKLWDFSFDEHIKYDLTAVIDHVLEVTGRSTVGYVGHSQGAMIMFGLLATQPKYNGLVKPFIAVGPATRLRSTRSPIRLVARLPPLIRALEWMGGPFNPPNEVVSLLASGCPSRLIHVCVNLAFLVTGYNKQQMVEERLPVYLAHTPSGTSTKNIVHWLKNVRSKKFQMYDYGSRDNQNKYGSSVAPEYDLSKITNQHMAILWSKQDILAAADDSTWLIGSLGNGKLLTNIALPDSYNFGHMDFIWGKDAGKLVNVPVIRLLRDNMD